MIRVLSFARSCDWIDGRRVRACRFERRSSLPVSAACVVANGMRESLSAALGSPVPVRLLEPVLPDPAAWELILAGARVFLARGAQAEAALIFRAADALSLACGVFGEAATEDRPLSGIENQVLARVAGALAGSLSAVCGPLQEVRPIAQPPAFLTFFEVLIDRPPGARIGIALATEPGPQRIGSLRIADLLEVEIEVTVECAEGLIEAGALLALQPESIVPMITKVGASGSLKVGGRVVARGECGALGENHAFVVSGDPKGSDRT